jgi:D-alanyl-lipoteichoic acid acyltransferase DltB (MBOAT superfamily)
VVKKAAIADQIGAILGYVDGLQPKHSDMLWIAAILYALEMYFDFAALTDIAVGTAGLFGIRSPENFATPFFAPNIVQFWRRWHMSLTFWLGNYVFMPVRMATRNLGSIGLVLSITINMTLIGLWHGIAWGFLIFGLIHSALLSVDTLTSGWRRRFYRNHPFWDRLTNLVGPFVVFTLVVIALVPFRAGSMQGTLYQMHHLADGLVSPRASLIELMDGYGRMSFGLTALAAFGLLLWELIGSDFVCVPERFRNFAALPTVVRWAVYYAALTLAVTLHQQSVHFIYAQF